MNFKKHITVVCLAVLIPAALLAQNTGALRGQVTDPSGAAVPNASVTLTGPNNSVKVAQTDNSGNYTMNGLAGGQYMVRVMAPGFTLFEKAGVDLSAGRPNQLDIPLNVEVEKQEVTVTDVQQISIDPDKNVGALVLKGADLDFLPDDPDDLEADLLALAGPGAGPNGGQIFVDGFSNGQLPPKDSIREIRINSNPFSAEFDATGYGRVEIFTKSGTDKMHASLQFNYGDSIWNARNPYSDNKPYYNTQNLNANISGSLFKKLSVFLDFERRANKNSDLINAQQVDPNGFVIAPLAQSIISPNTLYRVSPRVGWAVTPTFNLDSRYNYNGTSSSNNGVGGTNLLNTATTNQSTNQNIALTGTWIMNPAAINESRFQWQHQNNTSTGVNDFTNISVQDGFTTGVSTPLSYTHSNNYEFQDYTSITHKAHFIKFGARLRGNLQNNYSNGNFFGQYNWSSIASYTNFLENVAAGLSLPQIFAAGNGPFQYTQASGIPLIGVHQVDAGIFFQDDWKLKPNITLSLGLRYEVQDNIGDKGDIAPRVGLAWGIGKGQGRQAAPKTVLRLGYGWFYTRFPLGDTLNDERFNGINQISYTINNPKFLSAAALQQIAAEPLNGGLAAQLLALGGIPAPSGSAALAPYAQEEATYHTDPNLRAPLQMQTAIGVDRSLPKNIQINVNYINTRGIHQFQTLDINTPAIGSYNPLIPGSGAFPLGSAGGVYNMYESGGVFKQNQVIFTVRAPINSRISVQGNYTLGYANADSSNPSNPYNFTQDYGRAAYDIRNRFQMQGTINLPFKLRLNPNINYSSAPPFNITQGIDQYGNTSLNTRPAFEPSGFAGPQCTSALATAGTPCYVQTVNYGNFVINPTPGMKIVPVNYGNAFSQFTINARLTRTWGFGERLGSNGQPVPPQGGPGGPGGGGFPGGGGGNRGGGFAGGGRGGGGNGRGGGDSSGQKYTLSAGVEARNLLNTTNAAAPQGDLLSNRFDEALALANTGGGGQSANRRLTFNLRLAF